MTRILGLDPAASYGWALLEDDTYIDGGVFQFKTPTKSQQEKKGIPKGKKWADAWDWLETIIPEHKPDIVMIEAVKRNVSALSAHSYGFFRYASEAVCAKNNIPIYPIIVTQWKLAAIGYGGSDKIRIATELNKLFPDVEFITDDHSDACGIAYAGHLFNKDNRLQELLKTDGGKKKRNETRTSNRNIHRGINAD